MKSTTAKIGTAMAGIAAALAATPALAQDGNAAPSGLYVQAIAGYEGVEVESSGNTVTADADSVVYGIAAGYDLSLGGVFVGVEGEYSASGSSTEFPDSFAGARDGLDLPRAAGLTLVAVGTTAAPRPRARGVFVCRPIE